MSDLAPALVGIVFFFTVLYMVKIISDNRVRHKLIEKGIIDENVKHLFASSSGLNLSNPRVSLKWGLVLVCVGGAFLLIRLFPRIFYDESALGILFIFGGIGLFVHYFLERRTGEKEQSAE